MALNLESCDSLPPDEEPKLKYDRMGNDVENILLKDAVSCICVHTKFICLGTQWGVIHLLDHDGNTVPISPDNNQKDLQAHAIAINKISVDLNGDYIASCSDDGKVVVYGLYSPDNTHNLTLGRVVKSVSLDPYYFKSGSGRRFLTGDNKLTLYEKTFLNRLRSTVLCECEGYVQAIAWHERFVAWASESGVRVYDLSARCSLGLIQWERNPNRSIEDFRCNLLWSAPKTLMIGWVDTIRICVIRKRSHIELQTRDVTEYLVDPVHTFQVDYFISGLGPLDDQLVLLGVPKECDPETGKAQRPVLAVADYKDCEFCEVSNDSLNIIGFQEYSCNDYYLDMLIEENRFFIVSPKEIVIASPYDIDDRVNWLTAHERFEKAISVLEENGGKTSKHSIVTVGVQYLDHLLAERLFDEAAVLCARICKNDKVLWENQIFKFSKMNQLRAISPYVPRNPGQALSPHIYELIFLEYLKEDPQGFLRLVQEWNPALYKTGVIIKAVLDYLLTTEVEKNIYLEALALLYCYQKKYDKALTAYLRLQHKDVFKLITKHNMYSVIYDKILELMSLDCDKAIAILLQDKTKVPVQVVEKQLADHDEYLFKYLDAYSKVEPNGRYHGKLVRLYAKYAREKLLPFLKCSDNYPIQEALDVCQSNEFYPEMVFLLGRIGNTREALQIIIEKLDDINQAIGFCQEHNDKELWTDLIKQTVDKPECVSLLLKRIGNYVDPRMLIENIQPGCEIKDLKDSLAKMMCDYHLQMSVQEACKVITLRNYFDLHEKLIINQQRGISVTDEFLCSVCQGRIIIRDLANASNLIVYNCRHSFHIECLPDGVNNASCSVCSAVKM
ncbi:vacuolar protein sorting-associated protein 41 homolog [Danaus plexippus]|uniref:Vacuolar protein sorting-associated protein 41 homolog n=1 Tax=Danaus plexippus plexippus TaxID=278856 RepID=A0A212FF77_DANPL|nr:vacuolar protein sorting-associated protein 41 homolog [Danaus plexippus]OWR52386.1 putative light protein [Danaus plexippus plexippus]